MYALTNEVSCIAVAKTQVFVWKYGDELIESKTVNEASL